MPNASVAELWVISELLAPDGRVLETHRQPAGSPLRQFLDLLRLRMAADEPSGVLDITGVGQTLSLLAVNKMRAQGLANDDQEGVVLGTGSAPVALTDYKLAAQIAHGSGAGQMLYATQANPAQVTTADPQASFVWKRSFSNDSGGTITVREAGIYAVQTNTDPVDKSFCIVREVLDIALAVANGLACRITFSVVVRE